MISYITSHIIFVYSYQVFILFYSLLCLLLLFPEIGNTISSFFGGGGSTKDQEEKQGSVEDTKNEVCLESFWIKVCLFSVHLSNIVYPVTSV